MSFAAFFACVFYLGWAGGEVGEALADGILVLCSAAPATSPRSLLFAAGAVIVIRPMLPAVHPFRTGALCFATALMLGLAAGSLGLGPGDTAARRLPRRLLPRAPRRPRGRVPVLGVRQALLDAGSHILFVFLLLAGVLLLTGASIAGIVSATREAVATTTERARVADGTTPVGTAPRTTAARRSPRRSPTTASPWCAPRTWRRRPSTARALPDLYGDGARATRSGTSRRSRAGLEPHPEPEAEPSDEPRTTRRRPLTPMGNRRSAVTESDDIDYRMPKPSLPEALHGAQKVDTKGIERTGAQLVEALSHFNVEARVMGTVTGPHVTRYELRLAPGIKMSKVATLKDDLAYALAAEQVRILAPIPGKQAVGVEVPNRVRKMVHLGDVFQDAPEGLVAAVGLARQGHRRQGHRHRPRQAAAHPDRRHHGLR